MTKQTRSPAAPCSYPRWYRTLQYPLWWRFSYRSDQSPLRGLYASHKQFSL